MRGKEKCEFLKGIRKRMAEANGIPYEPRECTYEGECTGTCPFCEKEAAELVASLKKIEATGTEIKRDDVGILTIESLQGSHMNSCQDIPESQLPSISPIDPFRGSNNPFMSEKDLSDLRHLINRESEPLMGDMERLSEDDKETRTLLLEEEERAIRGRKRGVKRFVYKMMNLIKNTFESPLRGEIEEE